MESGRRAFAAKPFAAVHLKKDILEPAGISVGSFYHQFRDKGELLRAIVEEHSIALRPRFSAVHSPGVERTTEMIARESFALVFDMVDESPEVMQIRMRRDVDDPEILAFLHEDDRLWEEARAEDYQRLAAAYDFEFDAALAAELFGMLMDGAIRRYLAIPAEERPRARKRLLDGLATLILDGLRGVAHRDDAEDGEGPTSPTSSRA